MSDTPRTDGRAVTSGDLSAGVDAVYADFARQLEKELNEANEKIKLLQKELQLNNEAACVWDRSVAISERITLAKENKVMREALKLADDIIATWYSSEYINHPKRRFVLEALNQPNTTSLIVLTRNELIAEIEKMVCLCVEETNCLRCQWLARVKGEPTTQSSTSRPKTP